jgi:nucleoid-associated protein YgaU
VTTLGRAGVLLLGTAVAGRAAWSLTRAPLAVLVGGLSRSPGAGALTFEQLLCGGCAAVLVACDLWLATTTLLTVAGLLAREYGGRSRGLSQERNRALNRVAGALGGTVDRALDRCCPALLRAVVTTALGLTVATTVATPAPADDHGRVPTPSGLDGLALPDRTVGTEQRPPDRAVPASRGTVVVHTGDSLWGIAASLAPRGASDATLTRAWHRLYRVNVTRIGPDPDLILPGTRLRVPAPAHRRRDQP